MSDRKNDDLALKALVHCPTCDSALHVVPDRVGVELDSYSQLVSGKFMIDGEEYFIQYTVCPNCGEWIFLQVDNEESTMVLKKNIEMFMKLVGGSKHARTRSSYERTKSDLTILRNTLEKKLTGKQLYDQMTCSMHEIKFVHP